MPIKLSDHFTLGRLLKFVAPSIVMMIFTSVYTVVDGFFVSNFAGKVDFAALNLIFPFLTVLGAFGFMLGAGGSALVGKQLGEGDVVKARRTFTLIVCFCAVLGLALTAAGLLCLRPVAVLFGAQGELLDGCVLYGTVMISAMPMFMLQNMFQRFFVTARPKIGLAVIILAGLTNILGDGILVGLCGLGLLGAALASAVGQAVGGVIPLFLFAGRRCGQLHFSRPRLDFKALGKTVANGSSELMSNLAASVVGMLYNARLIALAGVDGIDAYGIIMYVNFIFAAIFFGFSLGSSPVVSYNFGAGNRRELKSLVRKSVSAVGITGVVITVLSVALSRPLAMLFAHGDAVLTDMTAHGMMIYSVSFLFFGLNIYASALFTALNNGLVSALLSFSRALVLPVAALAILPEVVVPAIDGVWLAVVASELVSLFISASFTLALRKRYGY